MKAEFVFARDLDTDSMDSPYGNPEAIIKLKRQGHKRMCGPAELADTHVHDTCQHTLDQTHNHNKLHNRPFSWLQTALQAFGPWPCSGWLTQWRTCA